MIASTRQIRSLEAFPSKSCTDSKARYDIWLTKRRAGLDVSNQPGCFVLL
jgi:hypothetical protein